MVDVTWSPEEVKTEASDKKSKGLQQWNETTLNTTDVATCRVHGNRSLLVTEIQ